ncbi:MAG: hypothetical protein ACI853_000408 [Paracoccaceae bacterium]|jgi:hypothetical protein
MKLGAQQLVCGSYDPADVTFLLKQVRLSSTDIATKERKIQSGAAHYSEMITQERRPDERYMKIFEDACRRGEDRIAREISGLARRIQEQVNNGTLDRQLTLCSLVRAGVPYGVLLHRELLAIGLDSCHFGISIIRDRGLDRNAIRFILERRARGGVVFVDGWTGKGAIATELGKSWFEITGQPEAALVVLADPSGFSTLCGSHEDWLIPSGILGANVSGLISRSILNRDVIGPDDFHGSVPVPHLADIDVSLDFVDRITQQMTHYSDCRIPVEPQVDRAELRASAAACVQHLAGLCDVDNLNRIKPGIAEATRAILRRRPRKVYIRSALDPDLEALVHLCVTDGIELDEDAALTGPYRAITLIEKTS